VHGNHATHEQLCQAHCLQAPASAMRRQSHAVKGLQVYVERILVDPHLCLLQTVLPFLFVCSIVMRSTRRPKQLLTVTSPTSGLSIRCNCLTSRAGKSTNTHALWLGMRCHRLPGLHRLLQQENLPSPSAHLRLQVVETQLRRGGAAGQAFLNSVGHTWPGGVVSGLGGGILFQADRGLSRAACLRPQNTTSTQ
jgi:hypothetical protein